jgi:filamentous hemagglutinin
LASDSYLKKTIETSCLSFGGSDSTCGSVASGVELIANAAVPMGTAKLTTMLKQEAKVEWTAAKEIHEVPDGVPYFRVQGGGSGNATSRNALAVNADGSVTITPGCTGAICVSVGDADHAMYYLSNKRPDGSVVVFEVDRATHNQIMENVVPQKGNSGTGVKLTDINTPGMSIELNQAYAFIMTKGSSNGRVLTQEEFLNAYNRNK